jgi:hypothetical protein
MKIKVGHLKMMLKYYDDDKNVYITEKGCTLDLDDIKKNATSNISFSEKEGDVILIPDLFKKRGDKN